MRALKARQQLFVSEYLVDLNATQAAIRAGYSVKAARQVVSRMMTNAYIQEAIQEAIALREKRVSINQDYVLSTIKETLERCKGLEESQRFDPGSILKGCELLGKHLAMWTDRQQTEISGELKLGKITRNIIDPKCENS